MSTVAEKLQRKSQRQAPTKQVRLKLVYIDFWSAVKLSFLVAICGAVLLLVAIAAAMAATVHSGCDVMAALPSAHCSGAIARSSRSSAAAGPAGVDDGDDLMAQAPSLLLICESKTCWLSASRALKTVATSWPWTIWSSALPRESSAP